MSENYIYLTHADEATCVLVRQRLKEAGIDSKVEDYNENAYFSTYGAASPLGKKVIVQDTQLAEAKKILNLAGSNIEIKKIQTQKMPKILKKIFASIFLMGLLALLVIRIIAIFKVF